MEIRLLVLMQNRRRKAAKVVVLSVFILARKSSTMSYAYEKGMEIPVVNSR
jgi:hypothetical protein